VPAVYFKFLPTVGSFVATHSHGFDPVTIQGVGGHLDKSEIKNLHTQITVGVLPPSFADVLNKAFHFDPARVLPLYVHNQLEGVIVYSGELDPLVNLKMSENFSLFALSYSHFCLEKKVDNLEVQDFVTEVYNRNYYLKALQIELERSRRLRQPLSVVKLAIDNFYEIEQSQGEAIRDSLLKSLASLVARTSRPHDLTCRTQMNEFAMILPHCSRKGAALRAERLRRVVESTNLIENGFKISISLGISEFPGMCDSADTLDETSTKALSHISDKGGNKICLYKAPVTHKPEFEVPAE
jgi:diguanylate cyclase (GGDEF)-like protein